MELFVGIVILSLLGVSSADLLANTDQGKACGLNTDCKALSSALAFVSGQFSSSYGALTTADQLKAVQSSLCSDFGIVSTCIDRYVSLCNDTSITPSILNDWNAKKPQLQAACGTTLVAPAPTAVVSGPATIVKAPGNGAVNVIAGWVLPTVGLLTLARVI